MSERRKILLLVPNLNGGGAERVMIHLLRHLDRQRYDVTFGLGHRSGHFLRDIPWDVRTVVFGHERTFRAIPVLAHHMRSARYDLIYTMTAMNIAAIIARAVALADVPLVLGARNHYSSCLLVEASHPELRMRIIRRTYPRAELIIGVSQGVCDDLVENFGVAPERALAIPNPLDLERIESAAAQTPVHPWLNGPREVPVIVNVAKLMDAKGHFDLLEAVSVIRSRRRVRLLLLGQGPLEAAIRQRIAERGLGEDVALVGFTHNPYQYMARADVFVLASHWEGFPNVLAEAMAAGAAVVSTSCPSGPSEIIEHDRTGLLVPVGAPRALAAAIDELLADETKRSAIAQAGKLASRRYAVSDIVSRYQNAFESVMAARRRRHS